jgi:sigma-B regulation protein RsbU (phosphoserine phosphatase)
MNLLIADDNAVNLKLLQALLQRENHELQVARDGEEAAVILRSNNRPSVAILDWEMPRATGVDLCRMAKAPEYPSFVYVILLTVRDSTTDVLAGLAAGADDYITKPFDQRELLARVRIGVRMATLEHALKDRVEELEAALQKVRELEGIIPICGYCKKIRDDKNFWHQVEDYIGRHSKAMFSHGFCPECYETIIRPQIDALDKQESPGSS